jgi:hypothetical protein
MRPATMEEKALAIEIEGNPPTLQCWIVERPAQ